MKIDDAIKAAIDGKAILFAGTGFTYGAINIEGNPLPNGTQLRDIIAKKCGIEKTDNSLPHVADYYIRQDGFSEESLVDLLKNQLKLGRVSETHKKIMSLDWKRVYTTNYDNVIETATSENYSYKTVMIDSPVDLRGSEKICVHINGSIDFLNPEQLHKSFKLTDSSYNAETLEGKPWFDFMERDFGSAKAIVIIGYSMNYDVDITRILSRPQIKEKVVFVVGPQSDPISLNHLQQYAEEVDTKGVDCFADHVAEIKRTYQPSPIKTYDYTSFIHEHMSPQKKENVSLSDLTHFYYMGQEKDSLYQKLQTGEYQYIMMRDAATVFMRERLQHKVFLAVSTIGNGKTTLCKIVRNELRESDVEVFTFVKQSVDLEDEIDYICHNYREKQIVVIIDDYYKHLNILSAFGHYGNIRKLTFLLTARTSKLAANYRKLINSLGIQDSDIKPLHLNDLTNRESMCLAGILENNKLLPSNEQFNTLDEVINFIDDQCKSSIGNVVLKLFDSSYMKNELQLLYKKATEEDADAIKELTIATLVAEVMNLKLTPDDIVALLGIDYVKLCLKESELILELFDGESNCIKVRSPVIARKILQDIIPIEAILSVLKKMIQGADRRQASNQFFRETMKAIISHSNFKHWTEEKEHIKAIKMFYDELRMIAFFNEKNPFYWEQYASICIDAEDYSTAKQCLDNAYQEARKIPGFVPFQVETVNARYKLRILQNEITSSCYSSAQFVKGLDDVYSSLFMYYNHPEDDHFHVFRLFDKWVTVLRNNYELFSQNELSILVEKLVSAKRKLISFQNQTEGYLYPSTVAWSNNITETEEIIKNKGKVNSKDATKKKEKDKDRVPKKSRK